MSTGLTPERWQEIKRLFEATLAREPADRPTFVADVCQGDAALVQELESLLAADARSGHLIDLLGVRGLIVGSRLGPYEIISVLGTGGMGEVYKARDTRLHRTVAIKALCLDAAAGPELLSRFEREARAIARLNHPHICMLYDVGSDQRVSYLVMEHVEGESLAEHLCRDAFSAEQVLAYAIQIAEALSVAHGEGITHRDLKPGNIMLTKRGVKLLDFGLAKLTSPSEALTESHPRASDSALLTIPGRVLGTLHYMAPEQLKGKDTDARTDIFAFGAVLYEMATRRKAFEGTTEAVVIDGILHRHPPPVSSVQPLALPSFDRVLKHCLAKEPADRWQSCEDLLVELRSMAARGDRARAKRHVWSARKAAFARFMAALTPRSLPRLTVSPRHSLMIVVGLLLAASLVYVTSPRGSIPDSIAVLPFVNTTADPELDYLSDGITDGLINRLSRIPAVRVIPRTLVFRESDRRADMQTIARSLNVQAIVTGRITKRADTVTVAAELVDVQSLSQLWGAQYRSSSLEVLNVEKAIATEIAKRLHGSEDQRGATELARQYSENPDAYHAYLRGRYHLGKQTREGYTKSIAYFEEALAKEPSYALAYSGLADVFTTAGYFNFLPAARVYPKAKQAALRALELDDQLPEAHTALASVMLFYEWNFPIAEQHYERAVKLDPMSAAAHSGYSKYLVSQRRTTEAIAEALEAERLDPVSPMMKALTGWMYYCGRRYDEAIIQIRKSLELNPNLLVPYHILTETVMAKGLGAPELRQILGPYSVHAEKQLAYVETASRGDERSKRAFLASLKVPTDGPPPPPTTMAYMSAALGQRSQALDWLEKAYAMRDGQLVWLAVSPNFDSLRDEPRFVDLVRRMGLPR